MKVERAVMSMDLGGSPEKLCVHGSNSKRCSCAQLRVE